MDPRVDKLISAIEKLRDANQNLSDNSEIKNAINMIFSPKEQCRRFVYTLNTDKLPFGCVVFPVIQPNEFDSFMVSGESINIDYFDIELDSKMFDYGLSNEQVAQMILYNIYHMVKDTNPIKGIRYFIDLYFTKNSNVLELNNFIKYRALLMLGLCDALSQNTSCLYLSDYVTNDSFLDSLELYNFRDMLDKVYNKIPGCENSETRIPKLSMLEWSLRTYCNMDKERIPALHLLDKVKSLTASRLYIDKFNAASVCMDRLEADKAVTESVQMLFNESKKRGGFIASLKYNGLRDIENDLYEFQIRAKNAETENDVMYALKQINARLAILDDYINENRDDPEIDRWIAVKIEYMEIREILAKKKLNKKSYGIFVDYDALDKLDEE